MNISITRSDSVCPNIVLQVYLRSAFFICCVFLSGAAVAEGQAKKLPVPEEAALSNAREEVRKLFEKDFRDAKREPQQIALVEKLTTLALEISNEPLTRYAMLVEARDLALQAGNMDLAMQTIDSLAETHSINIHESRFAVVEQIVRRVRSSDDARLLCGVTHALFRQAVDAGDYPLAEKIEKIESSTAKKSRDPKAMTEARADKKEADQLTERWENFQDAQKALQKKPDDAEAHTVVGLFLGLDQHNWPEAVTHLKMSQNQELILAAESEIMIPADAKKQVELADHWRMVAQSFEKLDRQFALERSLYWYRTASKDLSGIDKVRVDSQIEKLDLPLSETAPIYLTNLEEFDVIGGPWGLGKHGVKGVRNAVPIFLGGQEMKLGLGVHPPSNGFSQVKYNLDGRFGTFVTTVGLASDEGLSSSPVEFILIGDGKPLWKSKPLRKGQSMETCAGDISGVKVLELRAVCSGGHVHAHACWGDPYVMKARGLAPK